MQGSLLGLADTLLGNPLKNSKGKFSLTLGMNFYGFQIMV